MSQHHFQATTNTGEHVNVMVGWDPPLEHYFLDLERDPLPADDSEIPDFVFCSMHESGYGQFDLGQIQGHLFRFGVIWPDGLRDELADEAGTPTGMSNKTKSWPSQREQILSLAA